MHARRRLVRLLTRATRAALALAGGVAFGPGVAHAYHDTDPQTDFGAATLRQTEFRLGLGRFEVGATDEVTLGTMPLPWFLRLKNLLVKWGFFRDDDFQLALDTGLFWVNARDFDKDNEDVTIYCFPLRTTLTWRPAGELRYHLGLSYTAVGTRGSGGDDVEIEGVGVVETAVLNPTLEWDLTREAALLVDLSFVLFQRGRGNSDQHYTIDAYTTLDTHESGNANLKAGFHAWAAAGFLVSEETFNLRLLGGYGNYLVPVVNFSTLDPIPMVDFDIYWRF